MKKSIIPFASFILMLSVAVLGSAFTTNETASAQTDYFWYRVSYEDNVAGQIEAPTDLQFGGVARTQGYADTNDGCSGTGEHCLRGFTSQLSTNPAAYPIASSGAIQTTKTP